MLRKFLPAVTVLAAVAVTGCGDGPQTINTAPQNAPATNVKPSGEVPKPPPIPPPPGK